MRNRVLLFFLLSVPMPTLAQEVIIDTNYYAPPPVRRRVLTADPDQNADPNRVKRGELIRPKLDLMNQYRELHTWYIAAEGGFRTNSSVLSNSFDGLISAPASTKGIWGFLLGYTYRNAWAVESGYTHAPIPLNITIVNGSNPFVFTYRNSGYGIPLRLKRRIGSGRKADNGTGFWVTAGAWLIPNGGGPVDALHFTGRSSNGRRGPIDTLRLDLNTVTTNQITGLAELGAEYATRLSSTLEVGFSVRKYWGLGNALRSDLIYTINKTAGTTSLITADGSGWSAGIALRYIYGRQHTLKKASFPTD